ncbi:hypothetical protein B0F90DRAFT_1716787 [Multifurca ochricompacta]|uniref:Uncharacterized protein n=1 Tax=Multifurca ochricompacta TaxID=376703 RepID=A0AAD4QLA9_9AGAM|nr:hypothetical protein B0F90DRAFT_1716787 [Multifurca ochricompacta]
MFYPVLTFFFTLSRWGTCYDCGDQVTCKELIGFAEDKLLPWGNYAGSNHKSYAGLHLESKCGAASSKPIFSEVTYHAMNDGEGFSLSVALEKLLVAACFTWARDQVVILAQRQSSGELLA